MTEYRIVIESAAENDLNEIIAHIYVVLHEPETAKNLYQKFKSSIMSLNTMPERCSLICEEPYKMLGVRKLIIDNYICFYHADTESKVVRILRILYNRREWEKFLII